MAISDSEYTAWLSSQSAMRCVLVEAVVNVGGSDITRYMSNKGYVTGASDTPANTAYKAIISGGIKLTETLSLDSNPTLSFGDIEIDNASGAFDSWLLDVWEQRAVSVYFGDMRWARSDFRRVFKGTMGGINSSAKGKLNISLRDDLQRLNVSVTRQTIGGTALNATKLVPLTFGECFNVSPVLIDATTHQYKVHDSYIERFIEIRDNGVPVEIVDTPPTELTTGLATGTFKLKATPAGTVTASVQGSQAGGYSANPVDIVVKLIQNYGTTDSMTVPYDSTNFNNFKTANPVNIGIYLNEKANLLAVCQDAVGSIGGQIAMSRQGDLKILRIDFPPSGTPTPITKSHIVEGTLAIDSKIPVKAATKIGYAKNWTVQDNLQTAIPEKHKIIYGEEWLVSVQSDSTVGTTYKTSLEADQIDTYLLVKTEADTEANRRLNIIKAQRIVYKMTCFTSMFQLELGQAVTLTHNRFGLSSGKTGVVVGLEPDWTTGRIEVKVMV